MRVELAATLENARAQTEALLEPVSERELVAKVPTGTPLVWQLAQVAYLEELWLLRNVKGDPPIPDRHSDVYRAFTNGDTPSFPRCAPPRHATTQQTCASACSTCSRTSISRRRARSCETGSCSGS